MIVLIRGGGDLATGVALRLYRVGIRVVIAELAQPLAIRRTVAFAQAMYSGETFVEGITAQRFWDPSASADIVKSLETGRIPVVCDPDATMLTWLHPDVLVDARMLKQVVPAMAGFIGFVIGLGPGFEVGKNCSAIIETQRGHYLGRVYWHGSAKPDSGIPEGVGGYEVKRVLRAPSDGILEVFCNIGDQLKREQPVASVQGQVVYAPFDGVLRGILVPGLSVSSGMKIGDIDPRNDPDLCNLVSDKALAIGGGVLEAILSIPELRTVYWN